MSNGKVVAINVRSGMFVVESGRDADYFAFQLQDATQLELGSEVTGELDFVGSGRIRYVATRRLIRVYGHSGAATKAHALGLIAIAQHPGSRGRYDKALRKADQSLRGAAAARRS